MGLNFSYLLYFKRENIWKALEGIVAIAEKFQPPTNIHFPNHDLSIPLEPFSFGQKGYQFDDPEFKFFICMVFNQDPTLAEFNNLASQNETRRSPPDWDQQEKVTLCEIILSIYHQNPYYDSEDYVLFEFDTVGTWMSLLFEQSSSIRKKFIEFLEKYDGVCGVFNMEMGGGEVFWHKGRQYNLHIEDQFILPDEIERILHTKLLK